MNERRIPVVSLVAIVVLTFAVLFGLERLLAWGRADDVEEIERFVKSLKKDICSELPSGLNSTIAECHLQESGIFQYRWCFIPGTTETRSERDVPLINFEGRIGEPTDAFPKRLSFSDGGWQDSWRIGRAAGSVADWRLPRVLHPVSVIQRCSARTTKAGDDSAFDYIAVKTKYVPDIRRELNALLILLLVPGIFYVAIQRERLWQLISVRHDLKNMLQTLVNQLHRHLSVIADEDIRSRIEFLIENNINDTLLVVGRHDIYKEPPAKLSLYSLLNRLIDGIDDGRITVTHDCPPFLVIVCWEVPLRRLLENLLSNATRAARAAGDGWVRIRVSTQRGTVTITVENNGEIFPDHILKSFARWFSLRVRGGGIGLTVVREVMRQLGGKAMLANVSRRDGTVARVEIRLPSNQQQGSPWRRRLVQHRNRSR